MDRVTRLGITGQSGFIGSHLYNYLKYVNNNFELIDFNNEYFEDLEKLSEFVSRCDVIIHLAGVNRHHEADYIYSKNIELTDKLLDAINSSKTKPHIIFSSSTQEEKNNVYGNSKKEARLKLFSFSKMNGNKFTGLIIPNVFGPFGKPYYNSVVATFSHQIMNNETPRIEIDSEMNLIYVGDLVKIIENCIQNQKEQIIENYRVPSRDVITVSGLLKLLMSYYSNYIENNTIPYLKNDFELNLFNTFRSFINYNSYFPRCLKVNSDNRGKFVELIKLNIGGQVSFSTTNSGVTRGNHFHTRKIERFMVIKGQALIQMRKIGTSEVLNFELNGEEPSYVDIPIWFTHNIKNIGEEELITMFWINEPYDPNNPDTFFEIV